MFKFAKTRQNLSIIASMIFFLTATEISASQPDAACGHAVPMELDSTWRGLSPFEGDLSAGGTNVANGRTEPRCRRLAGDTSDLIGHGLDLGEEHWRLRMDRREEKV